MIVKPIQSSQWGDCRDCAHCFLEPDDDFCCGHPDAGHAGTYVRSATAKGGHCGPKLLKFMSRQRVSGPTLTVQSSVPAQTNQKSDQTTEIRGAMTLVDYEKDALRTLAPNQGGGPSGLGVMALGLAGESGEVCDIIKKHLGHGHELKEVEILKELGDVLWYIAVLANSLGSSLEAVAEMNLSKLRKRYPDGFSTSDSVDRSKETV